MPDDAARDDDDDRIFSAYGVASAVLAALSVAAIALGLVIWSAHRGDVDERHYQSRVVRTAADWTGVLINMNADNVEAGLQRLHDGTVGELYVDFGAAMAPYRQVVAKLRSRTTGRIDAAAIEAARQRPENPPGRPAPGLPPEVATRTDTVMVVATSVSENVGGTPQTVHWNLRLAISDVDGKLLISRLESIR
jgi:hypothetical protein